MRCLFLSLPLLFIGCTTDPGFTPAQRLSGEWTSTMDGSRVTMSPDGSWLYAYLDENGNHVLPGSYVATWDTITFMTRDGVCAEVEGRYEYDLSMDTLLLTLSHDDCPGREARMEYAWTRAMPRDIPAVRAGESKFITEQE